MIKKNEKIKAVTFLAKIPFVSAKKFELATLKQEFFFTPTLRKFLNAISVKADHKNIEEQFKKVVKMNRGRVILNYIIYEQIIFQNHLFFKVLLLVLILFSCSHNELISVEKTNAIEVSLMKSDVWIVSEIEVDASISCGVWIEPQSYFWYSISQKYSYLFPQEDGHIIMSDSVQSSSMKFESSFKDSLMVLTYQNKYRDTLYLDKMEEDRMVLRMENPITGTIHLEEK